ncbi:hypothetical protein R5R35_005973 [Gryllus longicercus]|uniref:BTB domain-containing protein n=1 Tax=Gryllus longicercus TaxID=2509291 RepID=A0AAN9VEQ9_9ORTH
MFGSSSVTSAFTHLKDSSNSVVFEALVIIRKFIAKNEHNVKVVREKNVLKDLVNILGKSNEKNLDITLSILGNCCLENESRIELLHLGIVKAVVTVFNSTGRDAIQGRACRVIGNLALTYTIAVELHKENVINGLINLVDSGGNNSIASQQMAVRALRILWAVESERVAMLDLNVIQKVAMLLTTPYENKEQKELLKTVIKALTVFTHRCSEQCAFQVHADGSVLQTLLSYFSKDEIKSSVIICVYNLCHIGSSRPILGSAGVVKIIVKELAVLSFQMSEPTESQSALISCLCLLCRESVNRAKIRRAGGLPIILSILRDCPKTSLQATALHALLLFVYDEVSLQELLKEGLITVLVTKLSEFVKSHGSEHSHEVMNVAKIHIHSKKRHLSSDSSSNFSNKTDEEGNVETSEKSKQASEVNDVSDTKNRSENWKRFRISSPSYQAVVQEIGFPKRSNKKSCNSSGITSPTHSGDFLLKMNSPERSVGSDSYQMGDWSPGSPRSMCFSPESSPAYGRQWSLSPTSMQTSPFDVWSSTSSPVSHSSIDCDIPEVYSPVCQDAQSDDDGNDDNDNDDICKGNECVSIAHVSDTMSEECDSNTPSIQCDSPNTNWEILSESSFNGGLLSSREESDLLILISRVSHMEIVVEDLVLKNTLSTLLNYIRLLRNPLPRAGRILARIVRTHHYFIHLVCQQFVLNIYASLCEPLHSACGSCERLNSIAKNLISKLSIVAESGFGEGELSHNLLKAEKTIRETVAVTVPFVIKTHKLLRKLLIDCKGLDILHDMVKSSPKTPSSLFEFIPISLSILAASLQINCPVDSNYQGNKHFSTNKLEAELKETISSDSVTIRFDNGEEVTTSKSFLSEHSPVFEAMLQGSFKEAEQECISLQDVSPLAFRHLLHIMKLGTIPCSIPSLTLTTALELLLVLDRFLLPGSKELSELIINQFLQACSTFDVYSSILMYSGTLEVFDNLRIKTIEYLLASNMSVKKRRDIFSKLLESQCSLQVEKDVFNVLREGLNRKCK